MQNADFFIHMAEIAGVFVGFGALIAVRTGNTLASGDIAEIRWVMSSGIWVVISALVPILVSGYGVAGHDLWLACSLVAIVLLVAILTVNGMSSEMRADRAATLALDRALLARLLAAMVLAFWLPTAALLVALALVVLGLFPGQEEPLYLTAIGLGLFSTALNLLLQVFPPSETVPRAKAESNERTEPVGGSEVPSHAGR